MRKEVPEAVKTCHNAGILVRMVTGDIIHNCLPNCSTLTALLWLRVNEHSQYSLYAGPRVHA